MRLLPEPPSIESLRARLGKAYAWVVLIVISGGGIAAILTSASFNVAVPALMSQFNVGHDVVQLVVSAYMAAMTIAMLPAAWLFERFGLRRCFLFSMCFMLAVSVLGSFSPSFAFLVGIRMAQGAAAGMMGPMGTVAVMRLFPPHLQGRAWGVVGFSVVLGPAVAPALGGVLIDRYGWQSIFWINIPFCILAITAGLFLLPLAPPRTEKGPDWTGLVLLSIATVGLIAAATLLHGAGPLSWQVLSSGLVFTLALAGFMHHAKQIDNPIASPGIFRHHRVAMGAIVALAYGAGLYGSTYLIPLFLQSVLGNSASQAGLALFPAGVALAFTMLVGGYLADHASPRLLTMSGLFLFGSAFLALWAFSGAVNYQAIVVAVVASRIGLGVLLPALNLGALRGLTGSAQGQATVFLQYLRQIGGMLGVAAIAVYVEWRSQQLLPAANAGLTAFAEGFLMIAIAFGISIVAAAKMHDDH